MLLWLIPVAVLTAVLALVLPRALPNNTAAAPTTTQTTPTSNAGPSSQPGQCQDETVQVTLPNGSAAQLVGHLCTPNGSDPNTVQLLVHGATYNSSYWSWQQDPSYYSYVWRALAAGYATFAVDRLGAGQSSRPVSTQVTFDAQSAALHNAVQALKSGRFGKHYQAVIAVGHSFGSAELAGEVAKYADVDAVIFTGSGHKVSKVTSDETATDFAPAASMLPRFKDLDPGYITTKDTSSRVNVLYDKKTSDEGVINFDHNERDTVSATEMATRPPSLAALTLKINVPVLLIDGIHDTHYCNGATPQYDLDDCSSAAGLYDSEKSNYQHCFAAAVVDSGHDLTTERAAPQAADAMLRWAKAAEPPAGGQVKCSSGPLSP